MNSENKKRIVSIINITLFACVLTFFLLTRLIFRELPLKENLESLKNTVSSLIIRENNGVMLGKDDWLFQRFDYYNHKNNNSSYNEYMENIRVNAEAVNTFAENLKELDDINVVCVVPPRKIDAVKSKLPYAYPIKRNSAYYEKLEETINPAIYDSDFLKALDSRGDEYIFYRTDHHWTTLGAYYAYVALGEKLGYNPIPKEQFTIEQVSTDFFGTAWKKAKMTWIKPDIIEYYTLPHEENEYITELSAKQPLKGFYDKDILATDDKYASFTGGMNAHKKIHSTTKEREKLLIVADSYIWALAPFLARHYDLEIIDIRDYKSPVYLLAKEEPTKNILILQNMESFSSTPVLRPLAMRGE